MSEITIVRRRLAALEKCEEILAREWGETTGGGPVSHYTEMMAVDATETCPQEEGNAPGFWISAAGLMKTLTALREEMEGMARHVENASLQWGVAEWHPSSDVP